MTAIPDPGLEEYDVVIQVVDTYRVTVRATDPQDAWNAATGRFADMPEGERAELHEGTREHVQVFVLPPPVSGTPVPRLSVVH